MTLSLKLKKGKSIVNISSEVRHVVAGRWGGTLLVLCRCVGCDIAYLACFW